MRVFGVVGWKNAGKTGLMERLVTEITQRGFSVSTIKHAHHRFDVDHPGKDSHRHRVAGASEVLLSSRIRWALMHENRKGDEASLQSLLGKIEPVDLVLIEGYKRDDHPKVEAHRAETKNPLISPSDETIMAIASDTALDGVDIPVFDLNDTATVADFILSQVGLIDVGVAKPDLTPPKMRNDCFALPAGVDWMPVDDALTLLRNTLGVTVGYETAAADLSCGRILAEDVVARRSNPPAANSAVDGYGFALDTIGDGPHTLPLVEGRSAAGAPLGVAVPPGSAACILTGAILPTGVDCVVLQEDVTLDDGHVAFQGPVKPRANTRNAGEDVVKDTVILTAGHRLRPQDIALMAAVGCTEVSVRKRLRVGVLSTGDEIVAAGSDMSPDKTFDANRPMLLQLAADWGFTAVDLGKVPDDRAVLKDVLDRAAKSVDLILTSGGASAGDEDHVSALLEETGALSTWRIAIKPGRPLAFGVWNGVPVFGLPGNPVAATICTLIFGKPAMSVLSGGHWAAPQGFDVPAAFEKSKKPGRREFLRAKINDEGRVEVFKSEGSGRISGLSWADGLVELSDEAQDIQLGDPVRYIPYGSFGIG